MRVARTGLGLVSFLALSLVTLLWGIAGIILFIHLVLLHGRCAPQWLVLLAWLITLSVPDSDD